MSHAQAPLVPVVDNAQLGTPNRSMGVIGILNTPPPQPGYRLRGSVTDPAHTRRRPAFEQVSRYPFETRSTYRNYFLFFLLDLRTIRY